MTSTNIISHFDDTHSIVNYKKIWLFRFIQSYDSYYEWHTSLTERMYKVKFTTWPFNNLYIINVFVWIV